MGNSFCTLEQRIITYGYERIVMVTTTRAATIATQGFRSGLLIEDTAIQLQLQQLISNVGLWAKGKEQPEKYLY